MQGERKTEKEIDKAIQSFSEAITFLQVASS